ncbi:Protein Y9C2UA.1 a [Aphelenchoides avenae]|nr:Protein Y9C2UA.1 a [Aphelenchus avenae]
MSDVATFYATIFGHRMRLHPLRWHTFNVSVWSVYQLFLFTDQSIKSPWRGFLRNGDVTLNRSHMEMMTLTVFPASMFFIVPALLVAHWKPTIKESLGFQWVFWIFVIFLVNSAAIVTYFCSEWRQIDASAGLKELVPVELYQAIVVVLFSVTMAYFAIASLVAFILWLKATFQGRAKALNVGTQGHIQKLT